jgi:hypothetical protein
MRVIGKMIYRKDRGLRFGLMGLNMKGIIKKGKNMDMV